MKRLKYILLCLCMGLCACEKTIDLDYHNMVPLYAVEGWLTPYETIVHVCLTRDMSDTTNVSNISDAVVTITDDEGRVETITYDTKLDNGYYTSDYYGEPGHTYQLDVMVDGKHFTSTSTMHRTANLKSFRAIWKNMMSERYLFGDVRIDDFPNEENYYYVHVFRNGIPYRSAVLSDESNPGRELQQLFAFNRDGSTDWDVLHEGDQLMVQVRTIDERSYDYLYSLLQMDNTSTNPVDNFSGGCLGYFSAFSAIAYGFTFYKENVEEE